MSREIKFRCWNKHALVWDSMKHIELLNGNLTPAFNQEINQFTGLKDRNGKEVYEGDIYRDAGGYIGKIEWKNRKQINIDRNDYLTMYGYTFRKEEEIEVIGNIYENPELLINK